MLFIDARKLGVLVDRTRRELTDEDVEKIANTYHAWRGEKNAGEYADLAERSVKIGCADCCQFKRAWL